MMPTEEECKIDRNGFCVLLDTMMMSTMTTSMCLAMCEDRKLTFAKFWFYCQISERVLFLFLHIRSFIPKEVHFWPHDSWSLLKLIAYFQLLLLSMDMLGVGCWIEDDYYYCCWSFKHFIWLNIQYRFLVRDTKPLFSSKSSEIHHEYFLCDAYRNHEEMINSHSIEI